MPSTYDLLPELETACQDLLWRSEADYPIAVTILPFGVPNHPSSSIDRLLANYPDQTPVHVVGLDDFFGPAIIERAWFDSRELNQVNRYRNLRDLLEATLADVQVYRIGDVEIDVYIIGRTEDEQMIGVKTKIVET